MAISSHPLNCPLCGQLDRVEKVTSVYNAGFSMGNYAGTSIGVGSAGGRLVVTGSSTHLTGTQQTLISQRLAPPLSPVQRHMNDGSAWPALFVPCLIFTIIFGGCFLLLLGNSIASAFKFILLIPVGLFGGMAVIFLLMMIRASHKKRSMIETETPYWQRAMEKWDRLYFCHRDDVVFSPQSGRYVRMEQMSSLLV